MFGNGLHCVFCEITPNSWWEPSRRTSSVCRLFSSLLCRTYGALLVIIAAIASLLLSNALPSRSPCYCVTIACITTFVSQPIGVVACPIYIILQRFRLSLALSFLLLHLRLPDRISMIRLMPISAASTISKPSDQGRTPRPRGRPACLVQGPEQAGSSPLAVVLVQAAVLGDGPGFHGFLDVVAVPGHADEGGHGGWAAVCPACDPVGKSGFLGEG